MPERESRRTRASSAIVVRGGTVVDETGERRADVLARDGYLEAVAEGIEVPAGATGLDAGGCIVAPGLVDLHTHLREPGAEDAECIETGARAGSLGGFTALTAMPNTDPPIDSAAVAVEVMELGEGATCHVGVAGALTVGRQGERLAPMGELAALGVRMFTDDGAPLCDAAVMRRALEYAQGLRAKGMPVVLAQHCEDPDLSRGGVMNEGSWSSRLGLPGAPAEAEELMVARDVALARLTSGRVHFLHLSSARSVRLVEEAKAEGLAVSAEVSPHHLALSEEELAGYDPVFKVNPPLRTRRDLAALRRACTRGVIDAIATDHAPHPARSKQVPLEEASSGMVGLETALAVCLGALWRGEPPTGDTPGETAMSVPQVIALMSWLPARIAGLSVEQGGDQGGPLTKGAPANLCVIDPEESWVVDPESFASRARSSPWAGRKLTGRVRHTVFRGEAVVVDCEAQR